MTSCEFIRWVRLHERRSRSRAGILTSLLAAAALAFFVHWRAEASGPIAASHAWLACSLVAFALAFMRVPFHLYWRSDAAFLAQLPIPGKALFDAALLRCVRAAALTTLVVLVGAVPLYFVHAGDLAMATTTLHHTTPIAGPPPGALSPAEFLLRHAILAVVLGVVAAGFLPAVATWAASLVRKNIAEVATTIGGAAPRQAAAPTNQGSTTILGALPGFASTVVIVLVLIAAAWLENAEGALSPIGVMLGLVGASVAAIAAVRGSTSKVMGDILRDVSALDRQQLATLEIRPPTALERAIASALGGQAGLAYRKDARLMRRRYPMAFALGALAFGVLVIIGLARPADPTPWLVVVLGGAGVYAIALSGRLYRPPIELVRLSATLPIPSEARMRAKVAWVVGWAVVFVVVPLVFATLRLL